MRNPTQEVLVRVRPASVAAGPRRAGRGGRMLLAVVGQVSSVGAVVATLAAILASYLLAHWSPVHGISMFGLILLLWSAIMLIPAFGIFAIFRRYRASGSLPKLPAPLAGSMLVEPEPDLPHTDPSRREGMVAREEDRPPLDDLGSHREGDDHAGSPS